MACFFPQILADNKYNAGLQCSALYQVKNYCTATFFSGNRSTKEYTAFLMKSLSA